MTYPFPDRSAGGSAQDHTDDHNEIHSRTGLGLTTGLTTGSSGHLAHQSKVNRLWNTLFDQDLPTPVTTSSTNHLAHHITIHDLMNTETWGPRGTVGQTDPSTISGWPGSGGFTSSHSTFASLQSAVNAAGTARKFRITASFAFTATIAPHANDEFWGNDGVTITRSGAVTTAIKPASAVANVKVMNLAFDGFNSLGGTYGDDGDDTINTLGSNNWEIGNCEFSNTFIATKLGGSSLGSTVHHCLFHDLANAFGAFSGRNHTFEDNEIGPSVGHASEQGNNKFVGTRGITWRHNYSHDNVRSCLWFDTTNSESLTEWNIFEACSSNGDPDSPMGSVSFESNNQIDGTVDGGPDTADLISEATKNVVRYNQFLNNGSAALAILHTSWTEVYGNTFYQDAFATGGANVGSIRLWFNNPSKLLDGHAHTQDLANNWIHDNYVIQTTSTRKAVHVQCTTGVTQTPWINNTKNNNFDRNVYELASSSHIGFEWVHNADKTFTQWQAVAQGSTGSGSFQDINGERV